MPSLPALAAAVRERLLDDEPAPLPGFGTLRRVRVPARVQPSAGGPKALAPPRETIRLVLGETPDAESIAIGLARTLGLPVAQGRAALRQHVDQLEALLSAVGEVTLDGVGVVRRTDRGVLFGADPRLLTTLNSAYEGLTDVGASPEASGDAAGDLSAEDAPTPPEAEPEPGAEALPPPTNLSGDGADAAAVPPVPPDADVAPVAGNEDEPRIEHPNPLEPLPDAPSFPATEKGDADGDLDEALIDDPLALLDAEPEVPPEPSATDAPQITDDAPPETPEASAADQEVEAMLSGAWTAARPASGDLGALVTPPVSSPAPDEDGARDEEQVRHEEQDAVEPAGGPSTAAEPHTAHPTVPQPEPPAADPPHPDAAALDVSDPALSATSEILATEPLRPEIAERLRTQGISGPAPSPTSAKWTTAVPALEADSAPQEAAVYEAPQPPAPPVGDGRRFSVWPVVAALVLVAAAVAAFVYVQRQSAEPAPARSAAAPAPEASGENVQQEPTATDEVREDSATTASGGGVAAALPGLEAPASADEAQTSTPPPAVPAAAPPAATTAARSTQREDAPEASGGAASAEPAGDPLAPDLGGLSASLARSLAGDSPIRLNTTGYTWVVSSVENRAEANRRVERYRRAGYRARVIEGQVGGRPTFRIAIGEFATRADAFAVRDRLPADLRGRDDIWTLNLADV